MTAINKLQINHLSRGGEVISVVRCFAGQISVFRGTMPSDLEPYRRALAGVPGPERFSITLDQTPFKPEENTLIGFGEHFGSEERTVSQFLVESGASENGVDALLLSFGLERFAQRACKTLPPSEERCTRLLSAMLSTNRVIVLNNPFEPVTSQWRERLAEFVVQNVRSRNLIIIVTELSNRPECWIDNEAVARIQLGANIQKTIGFASGNSEAAELIAAVRAQAKSGLFELEQKAVSRATSAAQSTSSATRSPSAVHQSAAGSSSHSRMTQLVGTKLDAFRSLSGSVKTAIVGTALGATALLVFSLVPQKNVPDSVAKVSEKQTKPASNPPSAAPEKPIVVAAKPHEAAPPALIAPPPPPEPPAEPKLVDLYPPEIRKAIVLAFEGKSLQVASSAPSAMVPQPASAGSATAQGGDDLIKFLKSAEQPETQGSTGSPFGHENQMPQQFMPPQNIDSGNNAPEEERREMIRQRFLEAINRAAQNRREESF